MQKGSGWTAGRNRIRAEGVICPGMASTKTTKEQRLNASSSLGGCDTCISGWKFANEANECQSSTKEEACACAANHGYEGIMQKGSGWTAGRNRIRAEGVICPGMASTKTTKEQRLNA